MTLVTATFDKWNQRGTFKGKKGKLRKNLRAKGIDERRKRTYHLSDFVRLTTKRNTRYTL